MHESFVQIAALVGSHAAILSSFAVEDHVGRQDGSTNDGGAIQKSLSEIATLGGIVGRLHVGTTEGILEGLSRFRKDRGGGRAERLGLRWLNR